MIRLKSLLAATALLFLSSAAAAQSSASAAETGNAKVGIAIRPILEARARYEAVEAATLEADALTIRVRAGAEATFSRWSLLAEGEATAAPVKDYNAFPFPLPGENQWRPQHAVIPDPENLELNRLQLQYREQGSAVTIGRQRINLDDQRWVGSVGWRQNEQTFDAVRGEVQVGPAAVDLTYAVSQRTIFGAEAGPRTGYDGDFVFGGISAPFGPFEGKVFAYLIDYDEAFLMANSSATYGGIIGSSMPLGGGSKLAVRASYARQSDHGENPFDYAADYWSFEGSTALAGFAVTAGWEHLGSDNGRAVQTPLATLHKFNGWADLFLVTPAAGLEDAYVSIGRKFGRLGPLAALSANLTYHRFESAFGDVYYGTEWNASTGFKLGSVGLLLKYADYDAVDFGADTRKLWLQAEWSL